MPKRRRLSDILSESERQRLAAAWEETEAAPEDGEPLPAGHYTCRLESGELLNSRSRGTPGFRLTFRVLEGDHAGRRLWFSAWFTPGALPRAKRDAAKLGITDFDQLDRPLPPGIRCSVYAVLKRNNDGVAYNEIKTFEVVGIDEPEKDAFAPDADGSTAPADTQTADGSAGGATDDF